MADIPAARGCRVGVAARFASATIVAAAVTSACGTTVTGAPVAATDGLSTNSFGSASPGGARVPGIAKTGGAAVTGSANGVAQPGPAVSARTRGGPSVPPTDAGSVVVAAAPILVGIPYLDQQATNTFVNSLGSGLATADSRAEYAAYIHDVNRTGGVAGHRLQPVWHQIEPSDQQSTYEQATCADFTQDHHVQFVIDIGFSLNFLSCLEQHGVMGVISTAQLGFTSADLSRLPGR